MVLSKKGFCMPSELEERSRTFMEWPIREEIWQEAFKEAKVTYGAIANTISRFEEVVMIVHPNYLHEAKVYCNEKVKLLPLEHNDSWMRDNGPVFVKNGEGELVGIQWQFNAWGNKFQSINEDCQVAKKVLEHYRIPIVEAPMVLEGGSIHVDGEGTLLTTEECLLNPNRNPHLTKEEIEETLKNYLGVTTIIWLKNGLDGDETDGHIDNLACFVKPGTILIQTCDDKNDPNYDYSQENLRRLEAACDAKGRKFEIIQMPQPPKRIHNGKRLTLSYLNYYPVTGGIVLPTFGEDAIQSDLTAIEIIKKLYPDREIIPIDGRTIVKGGGNVHCITQQMPIGKPASYMEEEVK